MSLTLCTAKAVLQSTTLLKTKSNRRKIVAVEKVIFCDLCFERRIRRYAYAYTEEDIIRPGINRDGRFELSDASVGYSEAPKRARSHTFHEHAHTRTRKLRHLQTYKHIHSPDRPPPAGLGSQAPDLGFTEEVRCVRRCRPQERVRPRCVSGPGPSCAAASEGEVRPTCSHRGACVVLLHG